MTIAGLRFVLNDDFFHHISLTNLVYHFQAFYHFAKYGVIPVEVAGGTARMTNKEL